MYVTTLWVRRSRFVRAIIATICCSNAAFVPAVGAEPSTPSSASSLADSAAVTHIEIDVEKRDAGEKWRQATTLVNQCASVDLKIWYVFGSARLVAAPALRGCTVSLDSEIEMGRLSYRCVLPPKWTWTWNLVSDAKGPRKVPPRDFPADLVPFCEKR